MDGREQLTHSINVDEVERRVYTLDPIERIESLRFAVFGVGTFLSFPVFVYFVPSLVACGFYAVGTGLIVSGSASARSLGRELPWAHVLAEAKLSGGSPTKLKTWLGSLLPGLLLLAVGHWWHPLGT